MRKSINVPGNWNIVRGYVAKAADRAALASASGLPLRAIRCGETAGEGFPSPSWSLRKGEGLAVLRAADLGVDRWSIADAVAWVQSQGAEVIEVPTGRAAGDGVAMLHDALKYHHAAARGMTPEEARARAAARELAKRKDRIPKAQALKIWRSSRYTKFQDALAKMPGWSKRTAYGELGPRNAGTGRPRKS